MHQQPPRYFTLLLTIWEERMQDPKAPSVWRFRLEDPRTGQQQGFTSFEALLIALDREVEQYLIKSEAD